MFGKEKRRAQHRAERDAHDQKCFEMGLHSTPHEFETAYDKAFAYYSNNLLYDPHEHLQKGAIQAFKEGRPENVRFLLSHHPGDTKYNAAELLLELVKDVSDNKTAALVRRTLENLPQQDKQTILDKALVIAVIKHSADTVKWLRANGGEYKTARLLMKTDGWNGLYPNCLEKLHAYQEHEKEGILEQMQQNLKDITARLEKAEQRIIALESGKAHPPAAPTTALQKVLRRGTSSRP